VRSTGSHSEVWPKIGGKLRPGSLSYDRSTFSGGPWDGIKMTAPEYGGFGRDILRMWLKGFNLMKPAKNPGSRE
jgi:hypothetical protein